MTDSESESDAIPEAEPESTDEEWEVTEDDESRLVGEDATHYLYWGAFVTLLVLALLSTVRFYLSASDAIGIWVAPDFVPVFQAVFNLAVVLGCAVGLSVLVRRMGK